jgi:acetyl esterase
VIPRDRILWYMQQYLRSDADRADLKASPLRAPSLTGQPPAMIITAGFDPLLDEGEAYAGRLVQAGVPVTYECFEGQIHAFLPMGGVLAAANHAIYRIGQAVRSRFSRRTM